MAISKVKIQNFKSFKVPFGFVGKGAQCIVKTELALNHKRAQDAAIILLEEPESHLSFSNLNHGM